MVMQKFGEYTRCMRGIITKKANGNTTANTLIHLTSIIFNIMSQADFIGYVT